MSSSQGRDELRAVLRGRFDEIVLFLIPRVDSWRVLEAELVAALEDESLAPGVGKAILALPVAMRHRVLPIAARDPRAAVRRALFQEWAPIPLAVARENSALLPPDGWRDLLRAALCDEDDEVRAAGAALAFDSGYGAELEPELRAMASGSSDALVAAAERALGGRPDGHSR